MESTACPPGQVDSRAAARPDETGHLARSFARPTANAMHLQRRLSSKSAFVAAAIATFLLGADAVHAQWDPDAVGEPEVLTYFEPAVDTPESLVIDHEDNIYISMALTGEIRRIDAEGYESTHAVLPIGGPFDPTTFSGIMGAMVIDWWDNIYVSVSASDPDNRGVWRVTPDGQSELLAQLPQTAVPNGIALRWGTLFIADSSLDGKIWSVPITGGEPEVWADHPLLKGDPTVPFPGPNGVQVFRGELYVSNSNTAQIVAFPLFGGGEPRVVADVGCDDFAFDVLANLYCGTDPFNTVLRVDPDGNVDTILDVDDGLDGPTAVLFGRHGFDRFNLYIANAAFPFFSATPTPSLMRVPLAVPGAYR